MSDANMLSKSRGDPGSHIQKDIANSHLLHRIDTIDLDKKPRQKCIDALSMLDMYHKVQVAVRINYEVISLMSVSKCVEAFQKSNECFNLITKVCSFVVDYLLQDTINESQIILDHINIRKLSSEYSSIIRKLIEVCESNGVANIILQKLNKANNFPGIHVDLIAEQESAVLHEYNKYVMAYNKLVDNSTNAFNDRLHLHLPKIDCAKGIRKHVTFV